MDIKKIYGIEIDESLQGQHAVCLFRQFSPPQGCIWKTDVL